MTHHGERLSLREHRNLHTQCNSLCTCVYIYHDSRSEYSLSSVRKRQFHKVFESSLSSRLFLLQVDNFQRVSKVNLWIEINGFLKKELENEP